MGKCPDNDILNVTLEAHEYRKVFKKFSEQGSCFWKELIILVSRKDILLLISCYILIRVFVFKYSSFSIKTNGFIERVGLNFLYSRILTGTNAAI